MNIRTPDRLAVREIEPADLQAIVDYWLSADAPYLAGMGVDINKMPSREQWMEMLSRQISAPIRDKQSYCLIWLAEGRPSGHSNIRPIVFGQEAYMHLHVWNGALREKGWGTEWVRMTLPWYFKNFELKKIVCEPYALNPAPNRTLEKLGFELVKEYITTPGFLNFEQPVKRWEMSYERFKGLG
jgi:RimJ/RimL family protein N-acetyltransferase